MFYISCSMINKEEVKHIAKLARLGLTEEEIKKFQKELSSILDYVEKLKEVDVGGIEPTSHSIQLENVMREDKLNEKLKMNKFLASERKNGKLLELAPETKGGYLKVKPIL